MQRRILVAIAASAASVAAAGVALAHGNLASSPQRFTFTGKTVRGKDLPIKVFATGPISGIGTVRLVEHPKTSNGTFRFSKGNLRVLFVHGPTRAHPDPAKCRATINAGGTYTIHGGTGLYAAAAGKGTYTEKRLLLGERNPAGKCLGGPNSTPKSITAVATMIGTLSLR
jgi:hypothetical protein